MLRVLALSLFVATAPLAQAHLVDPPHPAPTREPKAAVDPNTGALFLMGGRDDHVLDVWKLWNGSWQRVASGPFLGTVTSLAFDPVRNCLVATATDEAGFFRLQELHGTTWTSPTAAVVAGSTLLWHPVRAKMLVWMPPFWSPPVVTSTHTLWSWDGTTLAALPMNGLALFAAPGSRIGYDAARDRIVAPQYPYSLPWVHEWDGTTWTTTTSTGGASGGSSVFTDPFSGHAVFAWTAGGASMEWNGQAFVAWTNPGMPTRNAPALVANPVRQVCQLVGGAWPWYAPHADTWEFAGTSWQQVLPDVVDPELNTTSMVAIGPNSALAFDGAFGLPGTPTRTAIWNHGTWTVVQPPNSPPPRVGFALAGDPATGRAFLFGGTASGVLLADFWLWNGTDWQQLPGGPSGRIDHGMCFRDDAQRVVLYGGNDNNGTANYQTWEWDGVTWSLRSAMFPPHTGSARLSWHARQQRTVLTTFGLLGIEVWEWDGTNWFSTNPPNRPVIQELHATYDPVRESILVVEPGSSSVSTPTLGAIHEWHGGAWRSFAPEARLRGYLAVTAVPGTGLVVMNQSSRMTLVLEHDFPALVTSHGAPCPDPQRLLTASQPWLGRTYTLRYPGDSGSACVFASGLSDTQWGGVSLPFDLSVLGLAGCSLRVAADLLEVHLPTNGSATSSIALPATPALAGMRLFHQAATLAPGFAAVSQEIEVVAGSLW